MYVLFPDPDPHTGSSHQKSALTAAHFSVFRLAVKIVVITNRGSAGGTVVQVVGVMEAQQAILFIPQQAHASKHTRLNSRPGGMKK